MVIAILTVGALTVGLLGAATIALAGQRPEPKRVPVRVESRGPVRRR